ncbi:MAG: hypothetical protein AAGA64_02200 [Bacteroidota bacterium]
MKFQTVLLILIKVAFFSIAIFLNQGVFSLVLNGYDYAAFGLSGVMAIIEIALYMRIAYELFKQRLSSAIVFSCLAILLLSLVYYGQYQAEKVEKRYAEIEGVGDNPYDTEPNIIIQTVETHPEVAFMTLLFLAGASVAFTFTYYRDRDIEEPIKAMQEAIQQYDNLEEELATAQETLKDYDSLYKTSKSKELEKEVEDLKDAILSTQEVLVKSERERQEALSQTERDREILIGKIARHYQS